MVNKRNIFLANYGIHLQPPCMCIHIIMIIISISIILKYLLMNQQNNKTITSKCNNNKIYKQGEHTIVDKHVCTRVIPVINHVILDTNSCMCAKLAFLRTTGVDPHFNMQIRINVEQQANIKNLRTLMFVRSDDNHSYLR